MSALSAVLAVMAVLVGRPPWGWVRVRVDGARLRRPGRRAAIMTLGPALTASLVLLPVPTAVVVWTVLTIVATAVRRVARSRRRRAIEMVRDDAYAVVDALVAELRSGAAPATAVRRLAPESDLLAAGATAAETGGDVPAALVAVGDRPGAGPIAQLGHAWAVSDACGAPLASVLDQVRETARSDRELRRELSAGVAPARATASLVVAMPPLGLGLGTGLGVDPLHVVLTTVPGALCVAAGVAFAIAGVLWIDLVADGVEADA